MHMAFISVFDATSETLGRSIRLTCVECLQLYARHHISVGYLFQKIVAAEIRPVLLNFDSNF